MAANNLQKVAERIQKVREEVAVQAAQDENFRAALLRDPKAAICEEYGLDPSFFSKLKLRVEQENPNEIVLLIPPKASDELTDEQLEAVAGGAAFIAAVAVAVSAVAVASTTAQATRAGRRW